MNEPTSRPPRSRALGDIAAAVVLTVGAAIERKRGQDGHRAWLAAIPIVLVNFVAFYGQLSYFQSHRHPLPGVTIPSAVSTVAALALESIAIYLAWQAHVARLKGDSALRLRLGAYLAGLAIGTLNYSHFCRPGWRPDAYAIVFALASVISPALWGIHSNRESRDSLKAQELIEDHAVRLGFTRSFFHPLLSWIVRSRAAWTGENRPAEAIKLVSPPKWARGEGSSWAERRRLSREQEAVLGKIQNLAGQIAAGMQDFETRVQDRVDGLEARIAKTPPSAPRPVREPRPAKAGRAARAAGLTAAPAVTLAALSGTERAVALELMGVPELPSVRGLSQDERLPGVESTRRRAAARILTAVRASQNGNGGGGHGVDDES